MKGHLLETKQPILLFSLQCNLGFSSSEDLLGEGFAGTNVIAIRLEALGDPTEGMVIQDMVISHIVKIKIDQNCKTCLQILDIWCKNVRQKCRDLKKFF